MIAITQFLIARKRAEERKNGNIGGGYREPRKTADDARAASRGNQLPANKGNAAASQRW